jgi:hypothetical protein
MSNPFVYTDRDFASLRNQMTEFVKHRIPGWTADPSDFAYSIIEAMAYLGDMMSYYVDRAAMESNILTAQNRSNVFNLARVFGYSPGLSQSAACSVTLTNTGTEDVTVLAGTHIGSHSGGSSYEIRSDILLEPSESATVTVLEGDSKYLDLGVSNGSPNQSFTIPESNIDGRRDTLYVVTWNPLDPLDRMFWSYTEMLLDEGSDTYAFTVYLNDNGTAQLVFGDGVSGAIPNEGWNVGVYYRTCSGAQGNAPGLVANRFLVSWDDPSISSYAAVTVYGESPAFGWDAESTEEVRSGALSLLQAQRRAVTAHDYESLCRSDSRVIDAHCESLVWSRPNVWICPRDIKALMTADLSDSLEGTVSRLAPAGVSPTVRNGHPKFFRATVKILIPSTVDEKYATERVQEAIYAKFSYENAVFHESVAPDHLIRAVHLGVPDSVVLYVQVLDMLYTADWRKVLEDDVSAVWVATATQGRPPLVVPESDEFVVLPSTDFIAVQVEKITSTGKSRF